MKDIGPTKRTSLRIPEKMHERLTRIAKVRDTTVNQLIVDWVEYRLNTIPQEPRKVMVQR